MSSTMQITSAMKMISAAKLKKAQGAIIRIRHHANKLEEILININSNSNLSKGIYTSKSNKVEKVLLVVISSNRGLCGAFNANIVKKVQSIISLEPSIKHEVFCIGKKAYDILGRRDIALANSKNELLDEQTFENVAKVAESLMQDFEEDKYDKIELVYNQFKNTVVQIIWQEQFLPVRKRKGNGNTQPTDYIYEPNREEILKDLIPKSLKTLLYKAILDSNAAEHGARMTAMHKATENAVELKRTLTLDYNKARQAAITNEILEIVGGVEAMNGNR